MSPCSEVTLPLHDPRFAAAVEAAVGRIEATTDAELVVVAASSSTDTRGVPWQVGAGVAGLGLAFALWSPVVLDERWLPVELPLLGLAAGWAASRSGRLLRALSGPARMQQAVAVAAAAAFLHESVSGTRGRTGLLVYYSALEERVVLLPDVGLQALIPGSEWNAVRWGEGADPQRVSTLEDLLRGMEAVGKVLAAHLPPSGDNPNEIADAPRIRR